MSTNHMDLFVVKINSESSYVEGIYEIYKGYYGPGPLAEAERFRNIQSGRLVNVGPMRDFLLLKGLIEPENDRDEEYLREELSRIQEILGDLEAASEVEEADDEADEADEADGDGAEAGGDSSSEEESEEGSEDSDPDENENSAIPENLDDVVIPEGMSFPDYSDMLQTMKDAEYDYRARWGVTKPRLKTENLEKAYYVFVVERAEGVTE